jgi:hypothetical protein
MQVATDAKRHGVQPRARHSISASAFLVSSPASPAFSSSLAISADPLAIGIGAAIITFDHAMHNVVESHFARQGGIVARQPVTVPKRSDGWKNMRSSSLSIA